MKILKRILIAFLILLVLIVTVVAGAAHFYGSEIKALVVESLNKKLITEVKVSEVDFSVFQDFPKASIVFSDVVIYAVNSSEDTLLSAKSLRAKFNLLDIYRKQYKITGLAISDGKCQMLIDNFGVSNYTFWSESDSTSNNSVELELNNFSFANMEYTYVDYSRNVGIQFLIEEAQFSGNFRDEVFALNLNTTLKKATVQLGEMSVLEERTLFLEVDGNVDQGAEQLNFISSNIGIDGMNIKMDGSLNYGEVSQVNLNFISDNAKLDNAIALLPASIRKDFARFEIDGKAQLNGNLSGPISSESSLFYDFSFSIEDGRFKDKESNLHLKNTSLTGSVTNGKSRSLKSSKLTLNNFQTNTAESNLTGTLTVANFTAPQYQYAGNITLDLIETLDLLKSEEITNPNGKILATLNVSGTLAEIGKYSIEDWKRSKIEGTLKAESLKFGFKSRPQKISDLSGLLHFNNNSLDVSNLIVTVDKTKLSINGKFNNLIAYLLDEEEPLLIDARLSSTYIHLGELLAANSLDQQSKEQENYGLEISPRIAVYLSLDADELEFNNFNLNNLKGDLIVKNQQIDARGISFSSQEGRVNGDLFIREKDEKLILITQAQFQEVDIRKVFESFNNFGQESIRSEHLNGVASIKVNFTTWMNKQFEIDPYSIHSEIDFSIDEGELNDYKPLEALSKFVELEELKNIKFNRLQNSILIQNGEIIIPKFEIISSAINLNVAGTHTFSNDIDYHITLLLSEVLRKKARKPKVNEFGYEESDGLQKQSKLYLKMTGNIDDIKVAYDSKELKNNIKSKLSSEKTTVKSLLKDEFGIYKNDPTVKELPKEPSKKSPFQVEIDSSFIKSAASEKPQNKSTKVQGQNEGAKKSKFGKFLDKIAKPNDEEFVAPIEN